MKYLSFILLIALSTNCGSNGETQKFPQYSDAEMESDFSKCPNGAIPAIFNDDTSGLVKTQEYSVSKSSVVEKVTFTSGVELTLEQSGCKVLQQRYNFKFSKTPEKDDPNFWKALAILQFGELSKIDRGFEVLRDLMIASREEMELGQPFQGEDYSLTVDKFDEGEGAILVVSFDLIYPE